MGFEVGAVVNDSPVDCQSRERPRRAVRAASHNPVIRTKNTAEKDTLPAVFFIRTAGLVYLLSCVIRRVRPMNIKKLCQRQLLFALRGKLQPVLLFTRR